MMAVAIASSCPDNFVGTTGRKADGTVFMTYERIVFVPKRGHAVDDRADY